MTTLETKFVRLRQPVSYAAGIAKYRGPWVGWRTAFFDYDNDGWPGLLVVNGHVYTQVDTIDLGTKYVRRMLLFHNNGDGTFTEVAGQTGEARITPRVSRGAASGACWQLPAGVKLQNRNSIGPAAR